MKSSSSPKSLKKQVSYLYLFSYLTLPIGFLIGVTLRRNFSVEEVGFFFAVLSLFTMLSVFNDLGLTETLNYYGVKFYEKKKWGKLKSSFYYALLLQSLSAIIISVIIFFISNLLFKYYFKFESNILFYLLIFFISNNLSSSVLVLFQVHENYFYQQIFIFLSKTFELILILIIIFLRLNFEYIAFAIIIPNIALTLMCIYTIYSKNFCNLRKVRFKLDFNLYKKLHKYAFHVMLGLGLVLILGPVDIMFITFFSGIKDVAFYTAAESVTSLISVFLAPITAIMFPIATRLIENKKIDSLNSIVTKIYKFFLVFGVPFIILFTQFSDIIVTFLFGRDYLSSAPLSGPLAISTLMALFNTVNFGIIAGLGKIKQRNVVLIITGLTNIILNFLFFYFFGLVGVAFSTAVVSILSVAITTFLNRKEGIHIIFRLGELIKIVICGGIFFSCVYILKRILDFDIRFVLFSFDVGILAEVVIVSLPSFLIYFLCIFRLKILIFDEIKSFIIPNKFLPFNRKKKKSFKDY